MLALNARLRVWVAAEPADFRCGIDGLARRVRQKLAQDPFSGGVFVFCNRRRLHLYWYLIDPVFGWMHVRIQTWAPYSTQIYVNGREWMCRQLQQDGIAFERSDNKIVWVSDFDATAKLAEKFKHTEWPSFLIRQVAAVNPLLPAIAAAAFDGYWFGMDQAEVAPDILFKSRADLERIHPFTRISSTPPSPASGRRTSCAFSVRSPITPSPARS